MDRSNKIAFIKVKLIEGWKDLQIRQEVNIPERTYFRWKQKMQQDYVALVNKQKPGPKPQFHTDPNTSRRIQIWRKTYGWGPTKIEGHLDVHHKTHIHRPIKLDNFFKNFLKFFRLDLLAYINTFFKPETAPNIVIFFLDPLTNWIGLDPFLNQPFLIVGSNLAIDSSSKKVGRPKSISCFAFF